ncbi:CPBP family intramembrane glutamic endopeptidase [Clostridium sp. CF012]|uniref:CPBP family intramembrane glutamic endopeptidase n=1 Tax=Clostridium sp. CF012 TaxID=2843319 RepID=UPI001C0C0EE5|nr:CPBP family intramembrane glutamic endopeptidase [Clostridium sp. CF012]MBU3144494.1 CPBP family intramembrane metalloprotease [Clostridium sp. CF012]
MLSLIIFTIFILLNKEYFKIPLNIIGFKKRLLLDSIICFILFETLLLLSFYALSVFTKGAIKIEFSIFKMDYLKDFIYYWLMVSFVEEICFRGILYNHFINIWSEESWIKAALISSAIFGFVHIFVGSPFLNACIIGFIFCIIYKKCKNIFFLIILHAYNHGMTGFKLIYDTTSEVPTPVKVGIYIIVLLFITCTIICTYVLENKYKKRQNILWNKT